MSNSNIKRAMVFAAGMGTRLKPFTDLHPKALFPIKGKTLLARNIEYLKQYGVEDVIINVHHFAEQIIEHVKENDSWGINISFSIEQDLLLDTGGGLLNAAHYFDSTENFILYNADILTNLQLDKMIAYHEEHQPMVTLAVSERESSRYFLFNYESRLCGWENISTGERKIKANSFIYYPRAFSGIHIVNKELLNTRKEVTKFSITDWYLDICVTNTILGYNAIGAKFIDVGKVANVAEAELLFG